MEPIHANLSFKYEDHIMAELPEIFLISQQMKKELVGKTISGVEIIQPKCLNISPKAFSVAVNGARISDVFYRGKWIFVETSQGWILLCLGMGGEILLVNRATLPEKYRIIIDFTDHSCLAVNFWWFGYVHYADQLGNHKMTSGLGPNAIDLAFSDLQTLLKGRRGNLKSFMLDQGRIAGIGNFYIHDILFQSRLHPLRSIQSLSDEDIRSLATAIHERLLLSINKGGFYYEVDLFGHHGGFVMTDLVIGYKENQPCPVCGTSIQKIKTGSTQGFVCPQCQNALT
jgi:formamidopyrimidine-DNA glycosylase